MADFGTLGRGRQMLSQGKGKDAEQDQGSNTDRGQDGAGDFAAIEMGLGKRAAQTCQEENQSKSEEQKIDPGHIACAGIFGEDGDIA